MKHSGDPWTDSGMKDFNKRHEAPVRAFLTRLVTEPARHAKFLNMLSMLEHMGSRKIMLSQMNGVFTEDSLKHLAEEARHAYFFKRQAERVAKTSLDGWDEENTSARVPALMYFGRMDAGISKIVGDAAAYGWVSLIIELRACWLYGIYQDVLVESPLSLSLKSLLAEEDMHLAEMFAMCGGDHERLRALSRYETGLFEKLWAALEAEVHCSADNAKAA
ncbi:MAG: hypothetical protein IT559_07910 [Alphaproteobacteria bacterium]|nr:hypothetical protein [Alphaproteobacteria bacterium]